MEDNQIFTKREISINLQIRDIIKLKEVWEQLIRNVLSLVEKKSRNFLFAGVLLRRWPYPLKCRGRLAAKWTVSLESVIQDAPQNVLIGRRVEIHINSHFVPR